MKNKNTKTNLFLFFVLLFAEFFSFGKNSLATESSLLLNEILINGTDGEEFVELYNPTSGDILLQNHYFTYYSSARDWNDPYRKQKFPDTAIIKAHKFYLIGLKGFDSTIADWQPYTSDQLSNSTGSVAIFPDNTFEKSNALTFVAWGDVEYVGNEQELSTPSTGNSLERIDNSTAEWQESYVLGGTPRKENSEKSNEPENDNSNKDAQNNYAGKLKINELLPAPKTQNAGKEFVEITNISLEAISLSGMWIEDEKNHKVLFPNKTIAPKELFVLEGNFGLNNTSADSAYLIAKDGTKENPLDFVHYEKPKYDYAYAFDGSAWQWTSKITQGAKNQFDELLSGKIKKDKKIYANVYADFEVKTDKKAKKFTWNFGDGHKSYLKKTRHKYKKSGTYSASLKITGAGKENLLNFDIKVEKFGKPKLRITALSANPAGKDSENEWIEISNNTKKKINLKGWSVATGWKNLANHPIRKDFVLRAGKTKKLTRKLCAFTLGNKQAKIELRYPNGKVADKLKYARKDKSVTVDELYQKTNKGWQWVKPQKDLPEEIQNIAEIEPVNIVTKVESEELEETDLSLFALGKSTKRSTWQKKQIKQILLLFAGSNISPSKLVSQNQARVLGISMIKTNSKKNPPLEPSTQFWKKFNAKLNRIILLF